MKSLTIITAQAFTLINFRGSFLKELRNQSVTVHAVAPDFDDDIREQLVELGIKTHDIFLNRTKINPVKDFFSFIRMYFLLKKIKSDILLVDRIKPIIYGSLAGWLAGINHRVAIIEGLGSNFSSVLIKVSYKRKIVNFIVKFLYKISLSTTHKVIFLNKDDVNELVDNKIINPKKVEMIGGIGIDLIYWDYFEPQIKPITFILCARMLREKGVEIFANAAREIKKNYPDIRFILLGGLDSNPSALKKEEIESWVNEKILEWPGHVPVKDWLKNSSVFVLPSHYREGVPRSTQEAMAMGRPIITTDSIGCRDTVIDGVNGFLIPIQNEECLINKMEFFIKNKDQIIKMGKASRTLAEERFDERKKIYEQIRILEL